MRILSEEIWFGVKALDYRQNQSVMLQVTRETTQELPVFCNARDDNQPGDSRPDPKWGHRGHFYRAEPEQYERTIHQPALQTVLLGSSPLCRWRCFPDCRLGFGGDELI